MHSLNRGFIFLKQVVGASRSSPGMLKPSAYALAAGLAFALVCLLLIGGCLGLGWGRPLALGIAGFFICVLLSGQVLIETLNSALTAAKTAAFLNHEAVGTAGELPALRSAWSDLLIYTLARPGLWITRWPRRWQGVSKTSPAGQPGNPQDPNQASTESQALIPPAPGQAVSSWMSAAYLVIPIQAVEKIHLRDSLARANQLIQSHALRLNAALIGVRSLSWITGGIMGLIGLVAGLLFFHLTSPLSHNLAARSALFACLSLFIFDFLFFVALTASAYVNSVYATCLYLWSANAEKARLENRAEPVQAPALLAAALEK